MKKRVALIVAICMLAVILCAFAVACDNKGMSAYELAVENGFNGTLDEWLESLKGADGLNGADGADGKDGTNGRNGLDGQDVSIEEIFRKAVETGAYGEGDFLQFLKDYLSLNVQEDAISSSQALLSSVIVHCSYKRVVNQFLRPEKEEQVTSSGSGVIYKLDSDNGEAYIITNYHVVYASDATEETSTDKIIDDIKIFLYGSEYVDYSIDAQYIGGSSTYDIAVLKIQSEQLSDNTSVKAVTIADSDSVLVGSTALVVGNAAGYGLSATQGIVSVDSEYITISSTQYRVMRIDAAVNEGNSGGGLFNLGGQLIGIVNAKAASTSIENMGYAIPANVAIAVAQSIIDAYDEEELPTYKMSKFVLGVEVSVSSSRGVYDANTLSSKIVEEVVIKSVTAGSLAESMGLMADDIIVSVKVNGVEKEIIRTFQVIDMMLTVRDGDTIEFTVKRAVVEDTEDEDENVGEDEIVDTDENNADENDNTDEDGEVNEPVQTLQTFIITITAASENFVKVD